MISTHQHKASILKLVQEQLGLDLDAPLLREVAAHMEECPDCQVYVVSVRQTVELYRNTESDRSIPDDVSRRLYKVLDLKAH